MLNKKTIIKIVVSIAISLFIEIGIFNFAFFRTIGNNPSSFYRHNVLFSGISAMDDNTYIAYGSEKSIIYIESGRDEINELYVDINPLNADTVNVSILGSEMAEVNGETLSSYSPLSNTNHVIAPNVTRSKYFTVPNMGNYGYICVEVLSDSDVYFSINNIIINPIAEFDFNVIRWLVVLGVILIIALIIMDKEFIKAKYVGAKPRHTILLIISMLICVCLSALLLLSPVKNELDYTENTSYTSLAVSLLNGHTYLDIEVPEFMSQIDNPYSPIIRGFYQEKALHDSVYYNGKYYVYFGILPCLIFYLPVYALTGKFLSVGTIVFINVLFLIAGVWCLLNEIVKRYFKDTSMVMFTLVYNLVLYGTYIMFTAGHADQYLIPSIFALNLTLYGITLWISSTGAKELNRKKVFFGSLLMALVAGARQNMLLYSFIALVIFWPYMKVKGQYTAKKRNTNVITGVVPYVIVAIPLMLYNYVRFSNPFEFGTKYQITSFDMTSRKYDLIYIFKGLYHYLFALPKGKEVFPYIEFANLDNFSGFDLFYMEKTAGGIIATSLVLVLSLGIFALRKYMNEKKIFNITLSFFVLGIVMIFFDIEFVGVVARYIADFSFALFMVTAIVMLSVQEILLRVSNGGGSSNAYIAGIGKIIMLLFTALTVISCFNMIMIGFAEGYKCGLFKTNIDLFYSIVYALKPW